MLCVVLLTVVAATLLLPGITALPMELWDESRNANNAIEMAQSGNWLVTSFGGLPDHWNTKPPLFIWIVAAMLKAGVPPLLALRLPSAAAAAGVAIALYSFCRVALQDRLAGMLSAMLVLSSILFCGLHVSRTGDFDALLSLFTTSSVLGFWFYIERPERNRRLAIWTVALALLLGVMTKGVAALFVGPGLLAYAVVRGRLLSILRDIHLWVAACVLLLACAAYYGGRELLDPGYLQAVWYNEVGGRYLTTLDHHARDGWYYVRILFLWSQPGMFFLPVAILALAWARGSARHVVLLCLLVAALMLIVLSNAGTKAIWYAAPLVPLLALAIGVSLGQAAVWSRAIRPSGQPMVRVGLIEVVLCTVLLMGIGRVFYFDQFQLVDLARQPQNAQAWYATIVDQDRSAVRHAIIVDHGFPNDAGFAHYNPIAQFYSSYAGLEQPVAPGSHIDPSSWVMTCDPQAEDWLKSAYGFVAIHGNRWCTIGRTHVQAAGGLIRTPPPHQTLAGG